MPAEKLRKTCFVIMGLGVKIDFATGRALDLDKTYRHIIKPAVEEAGLNCLRADEIGYAGMIEVPIYEQLLTADVVIADISTSNLNVMYELGVRHALRPFTTIIIAADTFYAVPFDVTAAIIRRYKHLGEDIGYEEAIRFRKELTTTIVEFTSEDAPATTDSPVYVYLPYLIPPRIRSDDAESSAKSVTRDGHPPPIDDSLSKRLREAADAQKKGDFETAKKLLMYVRGAMNKEDPYIIQQLALVTYKAKQDTPEKEIAALREASDLLSELNPATSNDTETLGLWGAVHKRLWDKTRDEVALDKAIRSYERGFHLRNDYYNGINFAYLLNIRAAHATELANNSADPAEAATHRAEAIADFVQARRIRREVLSICEMDLNNRNLQDDEKYWLLATMAEAFLGIGDEVSAQQKLQEAEAIAPSHWMMYTTQEQMDRLRSLLADSPLKSL